MPPARLTTRGHALAIVAVTGAILAACSDSTDPYSRIHKTPETSGYGRVASVQIVSAPPTLEEGEKASLACLVMDSRGVILPASKSWRVTDTSVMAVSAAGLLVGRRPGKSLVTCSADALSATAPVSVTESPIDFVEVTPGGGELMSGRTIQLAAIPRDVTGAPVSDHRVQWSIDNAAVASVSATGAVTAYSEGTATITATSGGKTGGATLSVSSGPPAPAASVSIGVNDFTLNIGQSTRADAAVKDASGRTLRNRSLIWSVADPSIVTVSTKDASSATVIGRSAGTTVLTVTCEGISASINVTVFPAAVQSVSLTLGSSSIYPQKTTQASVTLTDVDGNILSGRAVTWKSFNTAIATVSSTGLVTAAAPGTVTIRATSEGKWDDATLTVMPASITVSTVGSVLVALASTTITQGQQAQAYAIITDSTGSVLSGQSVTWTSTDTKVATVSSSGLVTGMSAGSAKIRANVQTKSGEATQMVTAPTQPVASVSTTLASSSLVVGQTTQATAVAKDLNGFEVSGGTVAWLSLHPEIASVSSTGVVTAVGIGTATIRATIDGKTGDAVLTTTPVQVASVTTSLASPSVSVGQTTQASAVVKDAAGNVLTGRTITWSSTNPAVATISGSGLVTPVSAGSVTIRGTADGVSGDAALSVTGAAQVAVATVSVAVAAPSLTVGQTTQASAIAKDANGNTLSGRTIAWSSLNPAIATVSSTGLITAVAAGQATVRATVESKTGDAGVSVTATTVKPTTVTVTLNSSSLSVGQSTQASAVARDAAGNILPGTSVTWSSMSPSIASISAAGLVTALSVGSASISATVSGVAGSSAVQVTSTTVAPPSGVQPALPQTTPSFSVPAPLRVIRLAAGGDLQAALSALKPGDELRLASGATWTGQFLLPTFACTAVSSWITIRTDIDDSQLPAANTRITPSYASRLAKITSVDNAPALNTTGPICGLRLLGLELAHNNPPGVQAYGTVALGDDGWAAGGGTQTTLSRVPQDIIIDRVYMHGGVSSDNARCLALNTGRTVIINSWIAECHSKGLDSQAIEGWNGPGPYLIENNFLSSSGENVMFGGADPGISGLIPSDITIRRNHFWKDPAWKAAGWLVKNLFETKNAQRVLVENNVFENNWISGQMGMAIVIKSSFDGCPTCLWQGSTDITFRYNIVRNSPRGFNIQGHDSPSNRPVSRVRFENNLLYNIGSYNGTGEDGWQNSITHDASYITIDHNTFINNTSYGFFLTMAYGPPDPRQAGGGVWPNNIVINNNVSNQGNYYAIFNDGGAVGTAGFNAYTNNGTWSFAGNVIPNVDPNLIPNHPQASYYPSNTAAVGFMNYAGGDYRLSNGTAYLGKATDSRVPGADIDEVNRRTAGVVVTP